MIEGRLLTKYPLKLFRHGHMGWFWTDEKSITYGPHDSIVTARQARYFYAKRHGLKLDTASEARRFGAAAQVGCRAPAGATSAPPPARSRSTSPARRGRAHATTSAIRRAGKRAKARSRRDGNAGGKA